MAQLSALNFEFDTPRNCSAGAGLPVLLVHNFYQHPGGEDNVFRSEAELLRAHGHQVIEYSLSNDSLSELGKIELARKAIWNTSAYEEIREVIRETRPAVAHFHNTFPLVSPAGYKAARDEGVGVVQTLHNYRLLCPSATLYRNGRTCEQCIDKKFPWPGIMHRCYRNSLSASAVTAAMLAFHNHRGSWLTLVDVFVALTDFMRQKFVAGGLPESKIVVKPNFVGKDPGAGQGGGGYCMFVGHLAPHKGVQTLLSAWQNLCGTIPLKVLGDGPLRDEVQQASSRGVIEWLGQRPHAEVTSLLADAEMLIFPSEWYEGFPLTIVEALAAGTPIVASRIAAIPELVVPGRTGELFSVGDAGDLETVVRKLLGQPELLRDMRRNCRESFASRYSSSQAYKAILNIYEKALTEGH